MATIQSSSAPKGFGVDSETGQFVKLTDASLDQPSTAPTPAAPITPTPTTAPYGTTKTGVRVDGNTKEVQQYMQAFPGTNLDVAIGSVVQKMNQTGGTSAQALQAMGSQLQQAGGTQSAQKIATITSDQANSDVKKNLSYLSTLTEKRDPKKTLVSATEDAMGIAETPEQKAIKELEDQYNKFFTALEERKATLEAQNLAQVEAIQAEYEKKRNEMRTINSNRAKAMEILGTQAGRQRYAPTIQKDVIDKEVSAGMSRLEEIDRVERQLIAQAEAAKSKEQWDLLSTSLNLQRELYKEKKDTIQTMFENSMKSEQFAIQKAQAERENRKDTLEQIALAAKMGGTYDPTDLAVIDESLGYGTGFSESYMDFIKTEQTAKTEQDAFDTQIKLIDTLSKLSPDQSVTYKGTTYYGTKEIDPTKGLTTFDVENADGSKSKVVYKINPETNQYEPIQTITTKFPSATLDYTTLPAMDQLAAKNLSVQLFGKTEGADSANINLIATLMKDGKTPAEIRSQLALSTDDTQFNNAVETAASRLSQMLTTDKAANFKDALSVKLQSGDTGEVIDYLKFTARENSDAEQKKNISGAERTLQFLGEIKGDLESLKAAGIDTNIFNGTKEQILNKIGKISDKQVATTANKVAMALQEYRSTISGAAFSEQEAEEYKKVFPSISKEFNANMAALDALESKFGNTVSYFYKDKLGPIAYNQFIGAVKPIDTSKLRPVTQSFDTVDSLLASYPEYNSFINERLDAYQNENWTTERLNKEILNDITQLSSFNQPLSMGEKGSSEMIKSIATENPTGSRGGQCVTFLHTFAEFPRIGDLKEQKFAAVDKYGIKKQDWKPIVGDIVITGESDKWGHGAMVNSVNPDGTITLTESNYKGNERVTHTRKLSLQSPKIYGAIRPNSYKV